ncbi:MAG: hypothetical protein K5850_04230 [Bacteroidales bacterium]|nr:hypothetical protein [Bacteroidales bacterium]
MGGELGIAGLQLPCLLPVLEKEKYPISGNIINGSLMPLGISPFHHVLARMLTLGVFLKEFLKEGILLLVTIPMLILLAQDRIQLRLVQQREFEEATLGQLQAGDKVTLPSTNK